MTEQEELQYLLANSPKALPDDPSSSGWSTSQIKEKHYKGLVILYNWIKAIRTAYIQTENIVNALNDNSTDKPLSANMGKTLKELIDSNKSDLDADISRIDGLLASNDTSLDTIQKIVTFIKNNKSLIDNLTSGKINFSAIVDDLLSADSTKVLSAKQGKVLKDLLDAEVSNRQTAVANEILARQNADELLQNNINAEIGKLTNGTTIVDKAYKDHNGNNIDSTYVKIANIINALNDTSTNKPLSAAQGKALKDMIDAINTLLASDTTTLDTLQEVVNYIKNNKSLIDGITISKMAFTDLVKNLTTNNDNLPLAASQGYALKAMIDAINDAEDGIEAAEALRVIAEAGRVEAEEERATEFAGWESTLAGKEVTSNKVTELSSSSTDTQYPSAKCVYDNLALKANTSNVYAKSEVYTKTETQTLHTNTLSSSKSYTDNKIADLKFELGTYDLSVDSDTDTKYIKQIPTNATQLTVSKVEGVGYKVNQLIANGNFESASGWAANHTTLTINNGVAEIVGQNGNSDSIYQLMSLAQSHKFLFICSAYASASIKFGCGAGGSYYPMQFNVSTTKQQYSMIFTTASVGTLLYIYTYSNTDTLYIDNVNLFDLTSDFGSGNEPTSVSDCASAYLQRGINIYEYTPQQSSIKNNEFVGIKVEGTNHFNINSVYSDTTRYTITGDKVLGASPYVFTPTYSKRYFRQDEIGKTFKFRVLFTSNCSGSNLRVVRNVGGTSGDGTLVSTFPNYSYVTITPTSTSDYVSINYSNATTIEIGEVMLSEGNDIVDYVPYTSQTIPIDLTTIKDSNNNSLFPSGKLMGNSNVADFITPYNQESRYVEYTFTGDESYSYQENGHRVIVSLPLTELGVVGTTNGISNTGLNFVANNYDSNGIYIATSSTYQQIFVGYGGVITDNATAKAFLTGKTIQYERATYLTSNTDLTTLTRIDCESNGTVTLNNTQNVDMPNTIDYLIEEVKA